MSRNVVDIEQLVHSYSESMASQMLKIAEWAKSEEDIRYECNKLIDVFIEKANLDIKGRHEYGLAGGRIDSKYGGIIIEYKDPKGAGKIIEDKNSPGNKAVINQIQKRFKDFQAEEHIEKNRLFGIGCDGDTFIFIRFRDNGFEVSDPQQVTPHSVQRLLRALISIGAHGYSFSPDNLASHFGSQSPTAQKGIHDIYSIITSTKDIKAKTFFNQWKILFGEVCGYDVEGNNPKIKKLGDHYDIPQAIPAELLFSVHTYYAILMKFLAAEIVSSFTPIGITVLKKCVDAATSQKLRREMENIEQGGIWSQLGIKNFLEGDLFSWYLSAWNETMAEVVWDIVRKLDQYDPTTLVVEPAESRDLLKKLYQHLFPKSVRHDLGEYYTPDWLAEYVLDELGYTGNPDQRLLDPACGSGTFMVTVINRIKAWYQNNREQCGFGEKELIRKILNNVIGFDLNPLAVMASRTNYLLAIRDLLKFSSGVELPVYLCDSIMTPSEYGTEYRGKKGGGADLWAGHKSLKLKTSAVTFFIPKEISTKRDFIGKYADLLESCVRNKYEADEFLTRCEDEGLPIIERRLHVDLYNQLVRLDVENQNGIWARIIKNAFAPLFIDKVDYIAGNPPWVNWESLPEDYRDGMKPLWQNYNLFTLSGSAGRLGGGKKDLSMLFVYSCVDNYLKDKGRLGFVITQTVFKTKGAGEGFRNFQYTLDKKKTVYLKPIITVDMSELQPFEAATNRTSVFVCQKTSRQFSYPVPYHIWNKRRKTAMFKTIDSKVKYGGSRNLFSFSGADDLEEVRANVEVSKMAAIPVDPGNKVSPWLTVSKKALPGLKKILGQSYYRGYEGVNTGGLNGCFWIRILKTLKNGDLLIENLNDVGKIKLEKFQTVIEPDLVYPLLRGRDVIHWKASPSAHIILAQDPDTRAGIPEREMKKKYPKTYSYFKKFEGAKEKPLRGTLRGRALYKQYYRPTDPFYSMYNVSNLTMSKWKVVWRYIATEMTVSAVGVINKCTVIPDHRLMLVPLDSEKESYFLTAVLNSAPSNLLVKSYVIGTQISTHVLENIAVPKFIEKEPIHNTLASLSKKCAVADDKGYEKELEELEVKVGKAAAKLWGITDEELKAIQESLKKSKKS